MRFHPIPVGALAMVQAACAPVAPAPRSPMVPSPTPTCSAAPMAPVTAASVSAVAPRQPEPTPPSQPIQPAAPPAAFEEALEAAAKAITIGDGTTADRYLAAAAAAAGDDAHLAYLVAHVRATRFATAGDFERAAAAFVAVIPTLAGHPELPDEFWSHNALMMLREAQGDPASALAENDQATLSAARGTWAPKERDTLAFQKDRWHRAYLTRMLAESRAGSAKAALVEYAESALADYRTHGFPESIAVIEAYFAALDGKRDAALAAARRVDPATDDDVEDLYLVVIGLEAGGDHAGADAVRRVMRAPGAASLSRAIMLRWLDLDATAQRARGFTPWHAGIRQ